MTVFLIVVLIINVVMLMMYGLDKHKAIKHKRRISEKTLLMGAFLFGGWGSLLGMQIFRHKTQHTRFKVLVPIFTMIQTFIVGYLMIGESL